MPVASILRRLRSRLFPTAPPKRAPSPMPAVVAEVTSRPGFVIVQLGAYVGNTENDPIYQAVSSLGEASAGSTLLLVEPVRDYFEQLCENYRHLPAATFENAAIAERSGKEKIYRLGVDPTDYGYPEWLSQLSSLKESRMGDLWERYEAVPEYRDFYLRHRIEEAVDCLSFGDLLAKHGIERIDLLQIDVEGFEHEILSSIDFERVPIRFLNYERVLLGEEQPKCLDIVRGAGFRIYDHGQDTFCFHAADESYLRERVPFNSENSI